MSNENTLSELAHSTRENDELKAELKNALDSAFIASGLTAARYETLLRELRASLEMVMSENSAQKARIVELESLLPLVAEEAVNQCGYSMENGAVVIDEPNDFDSIIASAKQRLSESNEVKNDN